MLWEVRFSHGRGGSASFPRCPAMFPCQPSSPRAIFSPTAWVCCQGEQGLNWGGGI